MRHEALVFKVFENDPDQRVRHFRLAKAALMRKLTTGVVFNV